MRRLRVTADDILNYAKTLIGHPILTLHEHKEFRVADVGTDTIDYLPTETSNQTSRDSILEGRSNPSASSFPRHIH
jgi:hypothetical protein